MTQLRSALVLLVVLIAAAVARGQAARATYRAELNVSALRPGDRAVAAVVVEIAPGYHAQSHTPSAPNYIAMDVKPKSSDAVVAGEPIYPAGKDESYPGLGPLNVYEGTVTVYVPLEVKGDAKPGEVEVGGTITYQICDDKSCFMPQRNKPWSIKTTVVAAGAAVSPNHPELFEGYQAPTSRPSGAGPATEPARPQSGAVSSGFSSAWAAFGTALLAGLLFNVMPCVLPVLPLKAVGFYEVSQHRRARSFALGVVFSLGVIAVFAALSLVVLVFRFISWGELFTKWWFVWLILVPLLTVMAAGLLGGWDFSLPLGVYRFEPRHDTFGGNFFWGALTAVLATPCTAPLLPALLIWAAAQSALIGVPAVVMVGVGMSLPYLILSGFPEVARRFPRAGAWSELFKQMMGFLMLASATYFAAGRLVAGPAFFWAVVFVMAVAAVFLMARTVQISTNARPAGVAAALAVTMVALPVWWTVKINAAAGQFEHFTDRAFADARQAGKPVLVKFTANWCSTCQVIEGTVFRDPEVWAALKSRGFEVMKVDFSTGDEVPGRDLLIKLNPAGGIPLTAVYPPGGGEPVVLASVYSSSELLSVLAGWNSTAAK